eukprot:gene6935-11098_t
MKKLFGKSSPSKDEIRPSSLPNKRKSITLDNIDLFLNRNKSNSLSHSRRLETSEVVSDGSLTKKRASRRKSLADMLVKLDYDNNNVQVYSLEKDSLFVEDNQLVISNFSDFLKPLVPKGAIEVKVNKGSYIVEIANRNELKGVLRFSVSIIEDKYSKKEYMIRANEVLQKNFLFFEEKTIRVFLEPDLNHPVEYSGYIYKIEKEKDFELQF